MIATNLMTLFFGLVLRIPAVRLKLNLPKQGSVARDQKPGIYAFAPLTIGESMESLKAAKKQYAAQIKAASQVN
jgi:hypothetical protein